MLSKRIARSSARTLIMGGTSFSFPTAPSVQGDVLAYHVASNALLPTSRAWGIATTSTVGIVLANATPATAGVPVQYSPALQFSSTASDTDAGPASVAQHWRVEARPTSGTTVASALHFLSATDAGAYASRFNIDSAGAITAGQSLSVNLYFGAIGFVLRQADYATGLGNAASWVNTGNVPQLLVSNARTDAASAVVQGLNYDRNAALITNGATMFNSLVSWTDNSDAIRHMIAGYYTGSLWLAGGNSYSDDGSTATAGVHYGAGITIENLSALITIGTGATTSSTVTIPAGAVVLAVSCRVTTVIPVAATFTIGHAGSAALWGTGISTAAGTVNTGAAVPALFAAATAILITPNATPDANTGRIRICIHYYLPTAPTS